MNKEAYFLIALIVIVYLMMARIVQWALQDPPGSVRRNTLWVNLWIAGIYSAFLFYGIVTYKEHYSDVGVPDLGQGFLLVFWMLLFFIHLITFWMVAETGLWLRFFKNKKKKI